MNYCLFKLRFTTPVHFGAPDSALSLYGSEDHFLADTLFSALCREALTLWGGPGVNDLIETAKSEKLFLSDAMPWKKDSFFIPRPFVNGKQPKEELTSRQRKAMKRLKWIPVESFNDFAASVNTGERFRTESIDASFGTEAEMTRVHVEGLDDPLPYQLGIYRFYEDCGLYFIAGYTDPATGDKLRVLTEALGKSGVGGKVSSGLGKFEVTDIRLLNDADEFQTNWLFTALSSADSKQYLLLSAALPEDDDLDAVIRGASFKLVRRGGFVGSASFAETPRKKKTEYYLAAGSVVTRRFLGSVRNVAEGGSHPVVRFNRPLFLGVDL